LKWLVDYFYEKQNLHDDDDDDDDGKNHKGQCKKNCGCFRNTPLALIGCSLDWLLLDWRDLLVVVLVSVCMCVYQLNQPQHKLANT